MSLCICSISWVLPSLYPHHMDVLLDRVRKQGCCPLASIHSLDVTGYLQSIAPVHLNSIGRRGCLQSTGQTPVLSRSLPSSSWWEPLPEVPFAEIPLLQSLYTPLSIQRQTWLSGVPAVGAFRMCPESNRSPLRHPQHLACTASMAFFILILSLSPLLSTAAGGIVGNLVYQARPWRYTLGSSPVSSVHVTTQAIRD